MQSTYPLSQADRSDHRQCLIEFVIRGGALFFGGYFLSSWVLFFTGSRPYDATIWWVDLRFLPGWLGMVLSLAFGLALIHRAVWPAVSPRVYLLRRAILITLVGVLVLNTLTAVIASQTSVMLGIPVPLTAVLAIGLAFLIRQPAVSRSASRLAKARTSVGVFGSACCFALLAALAQMLWFGESDYRRPADAILVYGCKAYPDGTPSQALADRVHTACELYHQGLAPLIVMSGGPVFGYEGTMHETQAMADYAVSLGLPREAILLDPLGLNTLATADNISELLRERSNSSATRVLAVSHDYHLPRVKLSLEREGVTAYTVPAEIRRGLSSKPYLMARETAAWWYYYFRPIAAIR